MNSHPALPSPPKMDFSITSRFRDCLSRQIGEALRINLSRDNLLNSKAEYMANSLTRITMKEDPWEMKERTRKEEEQEELVKKQVEEFKRRKSIQPWSTSTDKETSSQPSQLTSQEISSQNLSLPSQSSHDTSGGGGGVHTLTGTECNIVCYETDEEEFTRPGSVEPSEHQLFSAKALTLTTRTPGSKNPPKRILKVRPGYNLAYLSMWWRRMDREGEREEKERKKKAEDTKRRAQVKRWLVSKKEKLKASKMNNSNRLGQNSPGEGGDSSSDVRSSTKHPPSVNLCGGGAIFKWGMHTGVEVGREVVANSAYVINERSQPKNVSNVIIEHHPVHGTDQNACNIGGQQGVNRE